MERANHGNDCHVPSNSSSKQRHQRLPSDYAHDDADQNNLPQLIRQAVAPYLLERRRGGEGEASTFGRRSRC
jgi:hypothetical protein